ncbi:MAG: 30S ribosomal protein S6 [Saprospiraceae bacterium]|nr:30S ribosomal protein S6 [Saprospiraceae bacterium]
MRHYEVTFIVDPTLSKDEIRAIAQNYVNSIEDLGCKIVHVDEMGLRQLAYPIKKKSSGVYYCVEYAMEVPGEIIDAIELALRRDERIIRFLTVALDKFGVKFNEDKRNGLIGKKREEVKEVAAATPMAGKKRRKPEDEEEVLVEEV